VDRKEYFQINFPGQPTVKDIEYLSEDGEMLPAKVYTSREGPATYTLTVVNYKRAEAGVYRASTAWAAWQFRKRGGEVTYDAYAVTDRIAGHQLQITNKDGSRSYIGIHPNARRLYIMEAAAPVDYPPPSDFPQTLSVLDDQGHRIRYELDDEGNRIGQDADGRRLYESVQ
jgi:YD repeat-containing protein